MRATERRSFGITDGMVLIAATAVGLAMTRLIVPDVTPQEIWETLTTPPRDGWSFFDALEMFAEKGAILIVPSLAAWTLATLIMRLRAPRSPWRRLTRQPGMMASLLATAVTGLVSIGSALLWPKPNPFHSLDWSPVIVMFGSLLVGSFVLSSWVTMAVCGRWRPEPTWLDRLGRFLGVLWIAIASVYGFGIMAN